MASQFQSIKKWKYDAFLNFRREDFDGSFVTDLYKRLEYIGINPFKHYVESEKGEPISTEISEAIEESRIAITIFSKEYASSRRCLEEITKIMECVDNKGLEFFLVFYRADASQVSRIIDQVLDKDEAYFKGSDLEKAQRWKDALSKAFDIAGFNEDYYYSFELIHW